MNKELLKKRLENFSDKVNEIKIEVMNPLLTILPNNHIITDAIGNEIIKAECLYNETQGVVNSRVYSIVIPTHDQGANIQNYLETKIRDEQTIIIDYDDMFTIRLAGTLLRYIIIPEVAHMHFTNRINTLNVTQQQYTHIFLEFSEVTILELPRFIP